MIGLGYDPQGNVINKNGTLYAFSQDNRLRAAVGKEDYRYDAHGRRVTAGSGTLGINRFFYNKNGQLSFQADGRKTRNLAYVHLAGSLVATREQSTVTGLTTLKFHHTDVLGTPVATTDVNRNVIERSEYEPYGKLLNRPINDGPGYTGHVEDAQTGLTYMQQRYYDPQLGAFPSVDPMAVDTRTGWNFCRYCYAANNPYKFTDPDGRVINFAVGFAIGFGIDAATSYVTTGKVDVKSALVSGLAGSLTGGVGGALTRAAASRTISTGVATSGTAATGATAGATSANIQAMRNGEGPSIKAAVIGGTIGAITSGATASATNGTQAMTLSRMAAAPVNSPAGIGGHVTQATAPITGTQSATAQALVSVASGATTEAAGKVAEMSVNNAVKREK